MACAMKWHTFKSPVGWAPALGASTTLYDASSDGSTFKAIVFGGRSGKEEEKSAHPENQLFILQYDGGQLRWFWLEGCKGDVPLPRYGHTFTVVGRRFVLFGGKNSQGQLLNETRLFCMNFGGWLAANEAPPPTTAYPAPRSYHTANVLQNRSVVVFAGSAEGGPRNDVWVLDTGNKLWNLQSTSGEPPMPRFGHSSVLLGPLLYIFGGTNETSVLNDMWTLNTENWTWNEVLTGGITPDGRAFHSCVVYKRHQLLVYGGTNLVQTYGDLCGFNTSTQKWSILQAVNGDNQPQARMGHRALICGNQLFVHAGSNGTQAFTDVARATLIEESAAQLNQMPSSNITELAESVISRMLTVVGKDPGANVPLPREEVVALVVAAQKIFASEPSLLELDGGVQVFGDVHGQYFDLLRLLELFGYPRAGAEGPTRDAAQSQLGPDTRFLFLGDYVDRGRYSVDCVCLIFALKIRFPEHVSVIRGNHEDEAMNSFFGFLDECRRTYDYQMWRIFNECFGYMPVAAIIQKKIFCTHGGISPYLQTLDQIQSIVRPVPSVANPADNPLLADLLWADPAVDPAMNGFEMRYPNGKRGCSHDFGLDVLEEFLEENGLQMMIRAHELVQDGFEIWGGGRLITVFSAPNYCGEYDNSAAILVIHPDLRIDFKACSFPLAPLTATGYAAGGTGRVSPAAAGRGGCGWWIVQITVEAFVFCSC